MRVSFHTSWPTGSTARPWRSEKQSRGTATIIVSEVVFRAKAQTCSAAGSLNLQRKVFAGVEEFTMRIPEPQGAVDEVELWIFDSPSYSRQFA